MCRLLVVLFVLVGTLAAPVSVLAGATVTVTVTPLSGCFAPTDFTLALSGNDKVDISWTKGVGAYYTEVRRGVGAYPSYVDDGYQVYKGTGESCTDEGLSLEESIYYYRAWSQTIGSEYSLDHAQANTGEIGMTLNYLLIGFIGLCLGLTAIGLVFRSNLLLMAAGLSWLGFGVFGFSHASGTGDVTRILGAVGLVMTLVCFFKTYDMWRYTRGSHVSESESYRKQLQKVMKRGRETREQRPRRPRQ